MTSSQIPIHAIHRKSQRKYRKEKMFKVQITLPMFCSDRSSDAAEVYPSVKQGGGIDQFAVP